MIKLLKKIWLGVTLFAGLIYAAAQISPDQASQNLTKWLKLIPILHAHILFTSLQADHNIFWSILASLIGAILSFFINIKSLHQWRKNGINALENKIKHLNNLIKHVSHSKKLNTLHDHKTLEISPDSDFPAVWHMGNRNGKPIMTFSAEFYVTNISSIPIIVTGITPCIDKKLIVLAHANVMNNSSLYDKGVSIPPGHTTKLNIVLATWPIDENKKNCIELDIAVIDQLNNEHWIKISFESTQNITNLAVAE